MKRDLLTLRDLSADEIHWLIARAVAMKKDLHDRCLKTSLSGKVLGMIFKKPSTRTRVSFEAAMYRLGGRCIFITAKDSQIGRSEPTADTARVLSRYVDGIVIRTFGQDEVEELARYASIPVINALTDATHPCQVLADLMTIREKRGSVDGVTVAWIGDGNNVANSWIYAAGILGFNLYLACPPDYSPEQSVLEWAAEHGGGRIHLTTDPREAVASADFIYTDVWASMGQEEEAVERLGVFRPYQVNGELMKAAPPHALVLHCLPAHREEEITDEVMEGPQSIVWDQAENRLHLQMAVLDWLMS